MPAHVLPALSFAGMTGLSLPMVNLWIDHLSERTLRGIDKGLANREPRGSNFFESDVKSYLGSWSFLRFKVMERLEKRGFVERVTGRSDEVTWIRRS
jgi:hypothetical protein